MINLFKISTSSSTTISILLLQKYFVRMNKISSKSMN